MDHHHTCRQCGERFTCAGIECKTMERALCPPCFAPAAEGAKQRIWDRKRDRRRR